MNEFLADLYGTRESIGASNSADVEKLAEAQVLDQVFKSEGIDVDRLPDEAIVKVAHELFGDNSAIVKAAAEGETPAEESEEDRKKREEEEAAAAKPEEEKTAADLQKADFLGRVMAHSFVQERDLIEKNALSAKGVLKGIKGVGKSIAGKGRAMKGSYSAGTKDPGKVWKAGRSGGEVIDMAGAKGGIKRLIKEHPGTAGALIAGGAALPTGFAAGRLTKKSSAIDILAEKRAMEILEANGIQTGQPEEEKLAEAVEQRAYELLAANGYTVE